jgi:pimeloyl-ACP methyl ester carboxylesterase
MYTHQDSKGDVDPTALPPLNLPAGIRSRFVDCSPSSLVFHVLESLPPDLPPSGPKPKLILCIHGFPELAYSWRYILPLLSAQGYHAVAFDQRGYGRTFSRKSLAAESFRPLNLIKDTVALVNALGYTSVACVVGHDFGAVTADLCALARPDMFKTLVMMSHPTKGPPQSPLATSPSYGTPSAKSTPPEDMEKALSELSRPRKHYKWYYCTAPSNQEMTYPTGSELHTFLRGYFHLKSADWDGNAPHALKGWIASELAIMPRYYIMDLEDNMRQAVARDMREEDPQVVSKRSSRWLPDSDLAVYVEEWGRNSFQGGLNWYRIQTQPEIASDVRAWSGAKISVPTKFVSGKQDWGTFQEPGAVEAMESGKSVMPGLYRGTVLVEGAGHWLNQEQPQRCVEEILQIVKEAEGDAGGEKSGVKL